MRNRPLIKAVKNHTCSGIPGSANFVDGGANQAAVKPDQLVVSTPDLYPDAICYHKRKHIRKKS